MKNSSFTIKKLHVFSAVVLAFVTTGCATISQLAFQEPTIDLQEIRVTRVNLTGGAIAVVLDVYNPNTYAIETARLELGIDLDDIHFGDAVIEESTRLESEAHSTVEIPLSFNWLGVGAGARALLSEGTLPYDLTAQLSIDTPIGRRGVSVNRSGDVPVADMIR
ncbi:MAG: LEA type 2 family protein [Gemmatimonadota bacterium]|nr:LEA type 2 family protein [Gemmatimonadota bacterium]